MRRVARRAGTKKPRSEEWMGSIAGTSPSRKRTRRKRPSKRARKRAAGPPSVVRLWRGYRREPSDENRNRLVEVYQHLVGEVVRRFAHRLPRSVDRADLATAGSVGLMSAIVSFDPSRGVRFEAYGEMRIRGALVDELRNEDWLPRGWRSRLEHQKRAIERLRSELGRDPHDVEVALALELKLVDYELLFGTTLPGTPVGRVLHEDGSEESGSALDVLADPRLDPPTERLTREEILRLVAQRLTQQEYRIVYLKYWEELSMREIGQLTHLSESRVCKIHLKLIDRLRDRFRSQSGEDRLPVGAAG
jgi:RNA polymerase sigma factor for flagellar operon FliA